MTTVVFAVAIIAAAPTATGCRTEMPLWTSVAFAIQTVPMTAPMTVTAIGVGGLSVMPVMSAAALGLVVLIARACPMVTRSRIGVASAHCPAKLAPKTVPDSGEGRLSTMRVESAEATTPRAWIVQV